MNLIIRHENMINPFYIVPESIVMFLDPFVYDIILQKKTLSSSNTHSANNSSSQVNGLLLHLQPLPSNPRLNQDEVALFV